ERGRHYAGEEDGDFRLRPGGKIPLRATRLGLRRLRSGSGVLRRRGSLRGELGLAPDLRTPPGASAPADDPRGFRRAVVVEIEAAALRAVGSDWCAVRHRQRHRAGGGFAPGERVPDLLRKHGRRQAGVGHRGRTEQGV
ncbi:MAG: hypothetical protein AVDCRST_MAG78-1983, partial [uncultured Rubrobacteraceae bacterium]